AEQIANEGLAVAATPAALAFLALALEVGLGVLLLTGVRRWWVLWPSTALVGLFLFLTGRGYWRFLHGETVAADCGCFGNLVSRTPAEAFWQDLLLLVPALLVAYIGLRGGRFPRWRTLFAILAAVGVVAFAYLAPDLPLDDIATRLKPQVALSDLCVGDEPRVCLLDVAPELAEGEHWVVMVNLTDRPETWVDPLNEWVLADSMTSPTVLASATPEALSEFRWTWGPSFEIRETPAALLRPLYRQLPRSFLVRDGVVVLTSPGLPAALEETAP
ncbi:MAG: hypothetical protein K8J08_18855, partial [Thermoanaerobaculia bacterium]|nr:hypothetical protein [Thermoanaerobaculia bacterium]